MSDDADLYEIEFPEIIMGEVAGKLTAIGALIVNISNFEGNLKIEASIPRNNIMKFKEWLRDITGQNGILNKKSDL